MNNQKQLEPRYAWTRAQTIIDEFIQQQELMPLYVAWMKAQLIIEAQARYYAHVGNSVEDSVSMAWEDFEMACRGRGEPGISGAIFHLWSRLPKKLDRDFKRVLEKALAEARYGTVAQALRYREKDYTAKVNTIEDGFDDPEAIPLSISPVLDGVSNARDLRDAINKVSDYTAAPFTVIEGNKGQQTQTEDDVF